MTTRRLPRARPSRRSPIAPTTAEHQAAPGRLYGRQAPNRATGGHRAMGTSAADAARQYLWLICIAIACSTRVISVAFVDSLLRASHWMIGTFEPIDSASCTS
jgi:hypothetical protein